MLYNHLRRDPDAPSSRGNVEAPGYGDEGDEVIEDVDEASEAEGGVDCDQATDKLQVPRPGLCVEAVEDDGAEAG